MQGLLDTRLGLSWKFIDLSKPLLLWINDGLMALFFLLVGLEIKREVVRGRAVAALAGSAADRRRRGRHVVPAALYVAFNWSDPLALRGWAIPAATDIAFSLGVLAALGSRVPLALKVFLLTLAIVDDLGAILIIAIFYTHHLSALALSLAGLFIVGLAILNWAGVRQPRALSAGGRAALGVRAEVGRACDTGGRRAGLLHAAQARRRGRGRAAGHPARACDQAVGRRGSSCRSSPSPMPGSRWPA